MKSQLRCTRCGRTWRAKPCGPAHEQQWAAYRIGRVTKAIFNLAKQGLIFHAVRVIQGRYPQNANEKALQKAALRLLKLNPTPREMKG